MKYKAYLVEENDGVYKGSIKEIDMPAIEAWKCNYQGSLFIIKL